MPRPSRCPNDDALSACSAEVEAQVEAHRAALMAAGMYAGHPVGSVARAWLKRVGVDGWARLDLAQQCATPLSERRLVSWLMVIGQLRPSPEYLILGRPYLGEVAARHHPSFYARFCATAAALGFDRRSLALAIPRSRWRQRDHRAGSSALRSPSP
jgi:hypothetical protein